MTGAVANSGGFFAGLIDEARIWNVVRSAAQIQQTRFDEITGASGLIGRFGLNEGSGTAVGNSVGAPNGTTVANPTWVAGFPRADLPAGSADGTRRHPGRVDGRAELGGQRRSRSRRLPRLPLHDDARAHHRQRDRRREPAHVGDDVYTDATAVNGTTYHYVVVAVDTPGNASAASNDAVATPSAGAGSAVQLNGSTQYVTFGAAPGAERARPSRSRPGSGAPARAWARRTGTGGIASAIPLVTKGRAEAETPGQREHELLPRASTPPAARWSPTSRTPPPAANHPVTGTAVVTSNVWHHAAADLRRRDRTWSLYLDGALDKHPRASATFTPEAHQHPARRARHGHDQHRRRRRLLPGAIDEARIWNVARSGAQILADRDHTLVAGTGLIARYGFNEGTGTTTASSVAGAPSGTLTGGVTWTVGPPLTAGLTNTAPVVDSVTITPSSPTTNQTLTANVTSHDAESDPLTTSYQWARAGLDISGATSATLNLATAGNGDRGDLIDRARDRQRRHREQRPGHLAAVTVVNSAPAMTTNLQDRTDNFGATANLDSDATDADNDTLTYSATGLPTGASIAPATGVISGTLTTAGIYSVTMTVSDGSLTATDTFTWTVSPPANTPPVVDSVTITPASPTTNQTLTANVTSHDAEGSPLTTSYQWRRAASTSPAPRARRSNLATAGNGDHGDQIDVRVTVNDGATNSAPVTSAAVTVVNSAPSMTTNIQDRSDTVGDTAEPRCRRDRRRRRHADLQRHRSAHGRLDRTRHGRHQRHADRRGDLLGHGDRQRRQPDRHRHVHLDGLAARQHAAGRRHVTITPAVPVTDQTLTANVTSHDADGDPLTTSYQWTRNGTDIAGATSSTLDLATAGNGDQGDLIRVTRQRQ